MNTPPPIAEIYRTKFVHGSRRSGYTSVFVDTDGYEISLDHYTAQEAFDYLTTCGITVIKWSLPQRY